MIFLWRTIRSGRGIVIGIGSTKSNVRTVNVGIIAQANWKLNASRRDVAQSKPLRSVKSNSIAMLVLSRYNFRIVRACARPWRCPRRSTLIVIILYQKMMKHPGRRCTQWWHLERVLIVTIWVVILGYFCGRGSLYIYCMLLWMECKLLLCHSMLYNTVGACARPWWCPRRSTLIVVILYQKMMKHPSRDRGSLYIYMYDIMIGV